MGDLVLHYRMDDNTEDSSPNDRPTTESGTPVYIPAQIEKGIDFSGGSIYFRSTNAYGLDVSSEALAISCWVNHDGITGTANEQIFISNNTSGSGFAGISLGMKKGGDLIFTYPRTDTNDNQIIDADFFTGNFNAWVHVVCVADWAANEVRFYRDNVLVHTEAMIDAELPTLTTEKMHIGAGVGGISDYLGSLDDIRLYDDVLSVSEINKIFTGNELFIGGYSILSDLIDGDVIQTALFRIRTFQAIISDQNDIYVQGIDNGDDILFYADAVLEFQGIVDDIDFEENKTFMVFGIDFAFYLAEDFPTYTASGLTASVIVTALINTYGNSLFTLNIAATTRTYTKTWKAFSPLEIIQELALNEGFTFFITGTQVFNFQPINYNDLGVTLTDGKEIFKRRFNKANTKLKNVIIVIGQGGTKTAGVIVEVRDPSSITKHRKRVKRIEDTSIITEAAALERALAELNKYANPLESGNITIARNFSYTAGSIIQITISQKGWVEKDFLIIESRSEIDKPLSHLKLAEIDAKNSDQLSELLLSQRITTKNWEDDDTPVTRIEYWVEEITVEAYLTVETQTSAASRDWNVGDWNDSTDWDIIPATWVAILSDVKMVMSTIGMNRIRDLIVGKAVTDLANANAFIAIGTGTTAAKATDTALETETDNQAMDGGFPQDGTLDGENEWQSSWNDGDFASGAFSEAGLFDAAAAGDMIARVTPGTTFNKAAGENLRARVVIKLIP